MQPKNRQVLSAIVLGRRLPAPHGIAAASLITGRSPLSIMQVIAGGLLGKASRDGGIATVILGAVLQEIMGVLIATIYVVFSKTVPGLQRRWIPGGLVYGAIIFFVMNYVVLPLSALKSAPHFTTLKFAENMAAMLVFGLIVAFFARGLTSAQPVQDEAATAA